MHDDKRCWHLLLLDEEEEAVGCARYLAHSSEATFDQLRVAESPLGRDPIWHSKLRRITENTLQVARTEQIRYAELGGWAIAAKHRNTKAALEIVLGSYLWAEMIGHCLCSCTATVRHSSIHPSQDRSPRLNG